MTKMYETMGFNENMSWCRPYVSKDGKAVAINEGEVISELNTGMTVEEWNALDDIAEALDNLQLEEVGCASCPWRDECDAMDAE